MKNLISSFLRCGVLIGVLALPAGAAVAQATFQTPELAADALIEAVAAKSDAGLTQVFGKQWRQLLPLEGIDPEEIKAFVDKARASRAVKVDADRGDLVVGADNWAFPVPLMRTSSGQWRFDTQTGLEVLADQRIGANERSAILASLAYVDAQREYATLDRNGDGLPEYARRLASQTGKRDGLIWRTSLGDESPLGENFIPPKAGMGYHGYRFRILEAQGPAAPGGAHSYLLGGRLMTGYALIAWPVLYGQSGVMTFIVNHDGLVYQRDLGVQTPALVSAIKAFDPGPEWQRTSP